MAAERDRKPGSRRGQDLVPRRSPLLIRAFSWYGHRYVRRHFHAVRLCRATPPPKLDDRPLIVFLNHPSWWDPMICLVVARRFFPDRLHYAPMDAAALKQYRFFSKLGFFGVEPGSVRGAISLLRAGRAILSRPRTVLWLTPQGRFADPRERPVSFLPGLGRLASGPGRCALLPLAVEYPFWEERLPEVLLRFGKLVPGGREREQAELIGVLERELEAAQDALAAEALARDQAAFDVILRGKVGVGLLYDAWRAARAALRGERFRRGHGAKEP
jgi:1-acyl-sn-glycerol-3-phosphate acyltransferase